MRSFTRLGVVLLLVVAFGLSALHEARAAVCTISSDTVVDQAYVDGGSCSSIDIAASVSTTWIGTVDLQAPGGGPGSGTVTVQTGSVLTLGVSSPVVLGADDDFVVETGATTTHVAEDPTGVQITARNITVQTGGAIDVSQKGCLGGSHANGFGPNLGSGVCEASGSGAGLFDYYHGAGGSYGGMGGGATPERMFGDSLDPAFLGSGGGSDGLYGIAGGVGGGRIRLAVSGTLILNGEIRADGGSGSGAIWYDSGSGSGGSVSVSAATLTGAGLISANGGVGGVGGYTLGNTGGGGRVKVVYDTLGTFDLAQIRADKIGASSGNIDIGPSNGTTYILNRVVDDGAGALLINSGFDFPGSGDYTRETVSIASDAYLSCGTSTSLTISSTSRIDLNRVTWNCRLPVDTFTLASAAGLSTTGTTLLFSAATSVTIIASTWTNVTTTVSVTQSGSSATFDIADDLMLDNFSYTGGDAGIFSALGGYLVLPNHTALTMVSSTIVSNVTSTLLTSVSIDERSLINASGKGCPGNRISHGYGPDDTTGICTLHGPGSGVYGVAGGGAGHGGVGGGGGAGGAVYDSETYPVKYGASGAAGFTEYIGIMLGGAGGGVVFLNMDGAFTLDGAIIANGYPGGETYRYGVGGAGAGGSVYASSTAFSGRGFIEANGGDRLAPMYGDVSYAGGGGRIFLFYSGLTTFDVTQLFVNGGNQPTAYDGFPAIGTTHIPNVPPNAPSSLGSATLVNGSTTGTTNPLFTFRLSDPNIGDSVRYTIEVDDAADFSSPLISYTSDLVSQGVQSFQVGQAAGTGVYTVGSEGQTLPDASYYWRVSAADGSLEASPYTTANAGTVAFIIDTVPRYLSFLDVAESGHESVTATSVRVMLSAPHFEDVTVGYSLISASTTASGEGVDYTLAPGTATILAGETSATIPLLITNDLIDEPSETIGIELSSPTNALIGSNTSTLYTILDNDVAGVTIDPTSLALAEGGASSTYSVVLQTEPTSTVQVVLTVPADLTVSTTTFTFTSTTWDIPQLVTVNASQDSIQEGVETATITHSLLIPTGFAYGYATLPSISDMSATIADDEVASIALAPTSVSVREGATGQYSIVLGTAPTSTVQVMISASGPITISTSTIDFTLENWNVPVVVRVTADNDTVDTGNRSATITNTVSTTAGGYSGLTLPSVSISVLEDDQRSGGGASGSGSGGAPQPIFQLLHSTPGSVSAPIGSERQTDVLPLSPIAQPLHDLAQETYARDILRQDAQEFKVVMTDNQRLVLSNFLAYGASERTMALGAGERRALVRDALETMQTGSISITDLERLADGRIPEYRNLTNERVQLPRVRATFRAIYGHEPNFKLPLENLAWNTLMYRLRFPRNLAQEKAGITAFRALFHRDPRNPFQWATVRALGYIQR